MNAPRARTYLEIIYVRYGTAVQLIFTLFAYITNIFVGSQLLLVPEAVRTERGHTNDSASDIFDEVTRIVDEVTKIVDEAIRIERGHMDESASNTVHQATRTQTGHMNYCACNIDPQATRTQTVHTNYSASNIAPQATGTQTGPTNYYASNIAPQATRTQIGHTNDSGRDIVYQAITTQRGHTSSSTGNMNDDNNDQIVFRGRRPATWTQRGHTNPSASNMNDGDNNPPPPYQENDPRPQPLNERRRPVPVRSSTAIPRPRPQTTLPFPVRWKRFHEVRAPHWSQSLCAFKRYEGKRNNIRRVDFGWGYSDEPEYYVSCHLTTIDKTKIQDIVKNFENIIWMYLVHRERYDCDCSLARLCLDLQPLHVQVHAPTQELDGAGYKHFSRTYWSSATSGCDYFEGKDVSWYGRHRAQLLTRSLQKHSQQCTCQCLGAWATPQSTKRANVVPLDQSPDLITLHRAVSEEESREWDDASGRVVTKLTPTDTTRQEPRESLLARFRLMLVRKKDLGAAERTSLGQGNFGLAF